MFKANKPETCAGILGGAEGLSEGTEKAPGGRSQVQALRLPVAGGVVESRA